MLGKIKVSCPNCGAKASVQSDKSEKPINCPKCKTKSVWTCVDQSAAIKDKNCDTPPAEKHAFENFEKYSAFTKSGDWKSICELNGIKLDSFGTKKELKVLADYLEEDEVVFALTSGVMNQTQTSNSTDWGLNTWLVALTSERFLFLDHAMLTSSVDTQSIRHDSVQAVSASQGLMLGKIQVDLGSRTVVIDNCNKSTVKVVAALANKWLRIQKKLNQQVSGDSQESLKLIKMQLKNQERIIFLLEEIKNNTSS